MGDWTRSTSALIVERNSENHERWAGAYVRINRAWMMRLLQRWYLKMRMDRFMRRWYVLRPTLMAWRWMARKRGRLRLILSAPPRGAALLPLQGRWPGAAAGTVELQRAAAAAAALGDRAAAFWNSPLRYRLWTTRRKLLVGLRQFRLGVHWKLKLSRILQAWLGWSSQRGKVRRAILALIKVKLHDGMEMWHRTMEDARRRELRTVLLQRYFGLWLWWPWAEKARMVTLDTVFSRWSHAALGMVKPTRALTPCKCVRALVNHSRRGVRARRLRSLGSPLSSTSPRRSSSSSSKTPSNESPSGLASVPFLLQLTSPQPSRARRREARQRGARRSGDGFECMAEQHQRNRIATRLRTTNRHLALLRSAKAAATGRTTGAARVAEDAAASPTSFTLNPNTNTNATADDQLLCVVCRPPSSPGRAASGAAAPSPLKRRFSRFSRRLKADHVIQGSKGAGAPHAAPVAAPPAVVLWEAASAEDAARFATARRSVETLLHRREVERALRHWKWVAAVGLGGSGYVKSRWTMPARVPLRPIHAHIDLEDVKRAIGRWWLPAVMGSWLAGVQRADERLARGFVGVVSH